MKIKTSITLSEDIIKTMDTFAGPHKNRSEFIETALRSFIAQIIRNQMNAHDLEIINKQADKLNKEARDVLCYQSEL